MLLRYLCPCVHYYHSERLVKVLAVTGAVFSGLYVGFWITILIRNFRQPIPKNSVTYILQTLTLIAFVIIFVLDVGLGFILYNEARNKSQRTCKAWLVLTGFIVVFAVVPTVSSIFAFGFNLDVVLLMCPWVAFKIYQWLTVLAYLEELKGNDGGDVGVVYTNSGVTLT